MVIDDDAEKEKGYVGQVDLEGKPVFRWYLIGFWAGDLGVKSKGLTHREFWMIYRSDSFSENIHLL